MVAPQRNTMYSLARTGFGLGVGVMAAQILFMLIGAAIFIPGYIMFSESKKDGKEANKNTAKQITGIVLMGVGVVVMGGIGFGFVMEQAEGFFE